MTNEDDGLRPTPIPDQVVIDLVPSVDDRSRPAGRRGLHDRRRPLRDLAAAQLDTLNPAERASLCAYWASVAPAAFLLGLEAYEHDSRL